MLKVVASTVNSKNKLECFIALGSDSMKRSIVTTTL